MADAEAQLVSAKAQLEQGEAEYTSGKEQLAQQQAALPDTMQSGADEVLSAKSRSWNSRTSSSRSSCWST